MRYQLSQIWPWSATKKAKPANELDTLEPMLTQLKLTAIRDQLDTLLDQASRAELPGG